MICPDCNYQNDELQKECLQCGNELLFRKRRKYRRTHNVLKKINFNIRIAFIILIISVLLSIFLVYVLNHVGGGSGNVETTSQVSQ